MYDYKGRTGLTELLELGGMCVCVWEEAIRKGGGRIKECL